MGEEERAMGYKGRSGGATALALLLLPGLFAAAWAKYAYPGKDDMLFCFNAAARNLVWPPPQDPRNAVDGEADLWFRMQAWIQSRATGDNDPYPRGPYLDIGTGLGRVVARFGRLFGPAAVHCVEPDLDRITHAKAMTESESWEGRNVTFHQTTFGAFEPPSGVKFQVITSVHVIQHIARAELKAWVNKLADILAPDGVVIIATKRRTREIFEAQPFGPGVYKGGSRQVTAEEFDDIAWNGVKRKPMELAVRGYSRWSLRAALAEAGRLHVVDAGDFHFFGEPPVMRPESQYVVLAHEPLKTARPQIKTEPYVVGMSHKELDAKRRILNDHVALCRHCKQCEKLRMFGGVTLAPGDMEAENAESDGTNVLGKGD